MFNSATSFNQDLNAWNTAGINIMNLMFYNATSFNKALNTWNTAQVNDMSEMFSGATTFNQSLGNWQLKSNVNMQNMITNSAIDCENYSNTLIGWNANPQCPSSINFNGTGMSYGTNAQIARDSLSNTRSWFIFVDTPSGLFCGQPNSINDLEVIDITLGDIYPNPSKGISKVEIVLPTEQVVTVAVFDLFGKQMSIKKIQLKSGASILPITFENLTDAIYLVKISADNKVFVKRVSLFN
jgi:surface protein